MNSNEMKVCQDCLQAKPADKKHFRVYGSRTHSAGKLHPRCIDCYTAFSLAVKTASRIKRSADGYEADASKRQRDMRHRMSIEHLMTHPCVDCGTTDLLVLEFDHVRGIKVDSIANCHRRKTYTNMDFGSKNHKQPPLRVLMLEELGLIYV